MANVIGQRVRRREDPRFLTGRGQYVDDLALDSVLHVTFVRSPWAHAKITNIDGSEAAALPGIQVFTTPDVDVTVFPQPPFLGYDERMFRPLLASDKVRFVGDIVAVVLSETRAEGVDAAELVLVDYEPLPAVTDIVEAARDEVLLYEDVGTNVCLHQPLEADENLFASCDVVTAGANVSQRLAACPLEPRCTAAVVDDEGRLTVWLSTQTPHQDRDGLAQMLGMEPNQVRVVAPDVGGGFGGKGLAAEDVLVASLARTTGRTLRWTETRSENMVAMHHGRAQRVDFEIGGKRDGTVEAMRLRIQQDAGAYPAIGGFLATLTAMMSSGVYKIPKIEIEITAVVTNTTQTGPLRGAGRPEATQVVERAIDMFASEIGLDPAEVRRRNFIPNEAFPYKTASGANYDIGDYETALDAVLEHADYRQLREQQSARRQNGTSRQIGIGLSAYVEVTNGVSESEFGSVEISADGAAIIKTGSFSQGQGHETTFAMIASERLGIPVEKITVVKGDTDVVARGTGTYGSKSTQIGGVAAGQASEAVVEIAKRIAADELEASAEDMMLDVGRGHFHVAGSPQASLSWGELAARLDEVNRLAELRADVDFAPAQPTFPFGVHLAVVEVDVETGSVDLKRMIALDDAGRIINPLVAEGQVHGGVAAGIAQALFEEVTYDEHGNPQNANLVTYMFPACPEFPQFERLNMETLTPINPLGVKGIGESGTIGATPAVHNAVIDAVSHLGVRHIDMPVNGESVWRALQDLKRP